LDRHTNGDASDDNFDRNEELIAALEYRLGLNADVYAISDVLAITAAALRRRLRSFERPTEEALGQRREGEPPRSGPQSALSSASDVGGTPAGNLGRRRLDDALMLFLLLQERQQETGPPEPGWTDRGRGSGAGDG
jgi:hypothetical protein